MNFALNKSSLFRILIATFFVIASLGQIQRIQLFPQIAVYLHEVLLAGIVIIFLPELIQKYKTLLPLIPKSMLLFGAFLVIQTTAFQLVHPDMVQLLYFARLGLYAQLGVLLHFATSQKFITAKQVIRLFLVMIGIINALGFLQYVWFPDTRWLYLLGWDDHYFRLISPLFDPGFTGLVLAIGLLIFILTRKKQQLGWQPLVVISTVMIAILLTYSRATYIALAIVAFFQLIGAKNRTYYVIILCFFAIIPFLPRPSSEGVKLERTASIIARIDSNQAALQSLSLTEVIWGRGLYTHIPASINHLPNHATAPDNSFVFLFVSFGVLGSGLLVFSLWQLRSFFGYDPPRSMLLLIAVHSLFNNSLFYIWTMISMATLFGISRSRLK